MSKRRGDPGSVDSVDMIVGEPMLKPTDTFDDRNISQTDLRLNKSDMQSTITASKSHILFTDTG